MIRGIHTSAAGMSVMQGKMDIISNNMVYLQAFKENNNSKLLKDIELFVLSK